MPQGQVVWATETFHTKAPANDIGDRLSFGSTLCSTGWPVNLTLVQQFVSELVD